jgi:hypothetical protein
MEELVMKVYIVTDGEYSDYMIEKVFSNREAAEEYKKWHNIYNDIEEYEVHDEPFTEGERAMVIRIQGTVYPEAVVDIKFDIRPNMIYEGTITRGAGVMGLQRNNNIFTVYNYRYIPADIWDEEKYKAKFTKSLYDLATLAKSMFAEGANIDMVNLALINKDEEDD